DYVDHFAQLLFEFAVSGQELEVFDENSEYISYPSFASARPHNGRRNHNPFTGLNSRASWSSHPLNLRVSMWPGRSSVAMPNDSDDSSVEILAEEPQSSSTSSSRPRERDEHLGQFGHRILPMAIEAQTLTSLGDLRRRGEIKSPNCLRRGRRDSIGLRDEIAEGPLRCGAWRGAGTEWNIFIIEMVEYAIAVSERQDPERTLGEHLAMFRRVFRTFRSGAEPQSPLQTPVITEVTDEQTGDGQDGGDSESGNEEIYMHRECRLPRANSVPRDGLIELDGNEPEIASEADTSVLWEGIFAGPSTSSQSIAASSTHPVQLPTSTEPSNASGKARMGSSVSASNLVLIANIPAGSGNGSVTRAQETGAQSRSTVTIEDDDIVPIDGSSEMGNEDDEVTIVVPPRTSVPIITLDDDVEEVSEQRSPLSSSSASAASGPGEVSRASSAEGDDQIRKARSNCLVRCNGTVAFLRSVRIIHMMNIRWRSLVGFTTTPRRSNEAYAAHVADVNALAASANDELLKEAEARLQQGSELIERVKHAMHRNPETSERDVNREGNSSSRNKGTSRDETESCMDADQMTSKDRENVPSGHGCPSKKGHSYSSRRKGSSKNRQSRRRSSENDEDSVMALPEGNLGQKRLNNRAVEICNEKRRRRLMEEEHNTDDLSDQGSERLGNLHYIGNNGERDN
ncbi:unnamed protein product, partial [Toxocara canis]|uniref:RING-type domain-containing protein n=1 Tax=Toxocara canis TaxID=6265 RepID=A0A183V0P0_TOXCA